MEYKRIGTNYGYNSNWSQNAENREKRYYYWTSEIVRVVT